MVSTARFGRVLRNLTGDPAEWSARQTDRMRQSAADLSRAASWANPATRRFFVRFHGELISAHRWCFIVACNNSGSSLLHSVLERTGQVSYFPREGQRYTHALTRANRRDHERVWSEYLGDLRMTESDSTGILPRLVHDWMLALQPPIHDMILEKTTANAVRMRWLQKAFPNSCFIGLVRDGFAVCEGIARKGEKSIERGARHWNTVNKLMLQDAEEVDRFLLVRYEDLVCQSDSVIDSISTHVGIDRCRIKQSMQQEYGFDTVMGRQSQQIVDMNKPAIARLTPADIESINDHAGEMLDILGYATPVDSLR